MEERIFRPRGAGFILVVSIPVFFVVLCLLLVFIEKSKISWLYAMIALPITIIIVWRWMNTTKHMIIIGKDYISAPRVNPSYEDENARPSNRVFDKERLKVYFDTVRSFIVKYELIHGIAFINIVFTLNDGSIVKIDTKRFSEKQFHIIRNILKEHIIEAEWVHWTYSHT